LRPELTKQVTRENYIRIFNLSRQNMRAWEKAHPELIN
jgi:ribosomal protein S14